MNRSGAINFENAAPAPNSAAPAVMRWLPDEMFDTEDHRLRIAGPAALAMTSDVEIRRLPDLVLGDEPRSDRAESFAAFTLVLLNARALDLEGAL